MEKYDDFEASARVRKLKEALRDVDLIAQRIHYACEPAVDSVLARGLDDIRIRADLAVKSSEECDASPADAASWLDQRAKLVTNMRERVALTEAAEMIRRGMDPWGRPAFTGKTSDDHNNMSQSTCHDTEHVKIGSK